jgi:predicted NBD/HSP70 family sugar kinase
MTGEEWQALCEKTLTEQNAHTLAKFPELASKSDLVAQAKAESEARAKAEAEAKALRLAIAKAVATGDLQALAVLMSEQAK